MAVITGKFSSGFTEVINGTAENDIIFPLGGWDVVNGGAGIDTVVVGANRADFKVSANADLSFVDAISGASALKDTTDLNSVERVEFNDVSVALDLATHQAGGQTALLIGAVLGKAALSTKKPLVGDVLELFDSGFTLQQLSGAVMRLDIWGVLANGGAASATNTQIANYLLTTVNGRAPDATTLAAAVDALNSEIGDAQGTFLRHLAESVANQSQVNLVGLIDTGLAFV
jgi:RTX calcium-binding nonapeptide repeat (4 copies)